MDEASPRETLYIYIVNEGLRVLNDMLYMCWHYGTFPIHPLLLDWFVGSKTTRRQQEAKKPEHDGSRDFQGKGDR